MARRRSKTSPMEDFMELVALLPWWGGVALALVSYVVLHRLAEPATTAGLRPGDMGAFVVRSFGTTLANMGQYFVPPICLLGAVASAVRRNRKNALVDQVAQSSSADALHGMTWKEFELLVGEAFRLQGYRVTQTGGGGADGGIDVVLHKGGEKFLVQCKQWKAFKVGVEVVRELYGVMAANGATGGFVVTAGSFSKDAAAFAAGRNVRLIEGEELFRMIQRAKGSLVSDRTSADVSGGREPVAVRTASHVPACPSCGAAMVERLARKGSNAGYRFWGCSGYPVCRGVRALDAKNEK